MFKKIDFSRIAIAAIILSLTLIYPLLWLKMLADPIQYTGADFIAFYAAGRIADNEGADQAYDLNLQKKYQEGVVGFDFELSEVNPFVHPPFIIPLTQLAATPNYLDSFQRWGLLMLFIFMAGIPFLVLSAGATLARNEKLIFAFGLVLFFPSFQSIILGQDNAVVFLGIALWMWGLFQKKDWAAALGLALTTARPHFALFLLLPFLFKRRAIFGWFIVFTFILVLISFACAGFGGVEGFFRILTVSGGGENFKINEENMINLIGLMRRAFPLLSANLVRASGWAFYAIAFLSLGIYYGRGNGSIEKQISLAAIAAVFFSPHSHAQDMILFIIPIVVLIHTLLEKKSLAPNHAVLIPLSISLVLLFSYYSPMLTHSIPYALMIGLLFTIWKNQNNPPIPS